MSMAQVSISSLAKASGVFEVWQEDPRSLLLTQQNIKAAMRLPSVKSVCFSLPDLRL